jgi:hypothetical protein
MGCGDLRAIYGTGGTTLSLINTLLANDGASVASMPLKGNPMAGTPELVGWGVQNVIADTNRENQLISADMYDARTAEYDVMGASSLVNSNVYWTRVPFRGGVRNVSVRNNTAAGLPLAFFIDNYPTGTYPTTRCSFSNAYQLKVNQVLTVATAQTTWISTGVAPTPPIKAAKYAILGAKVNQLTDCAVIRFSHADFNGYKPGFPVQDNTNVAIARANSVLDGTFNFPGYQFVWMDLNLGTGCPVFQASSAASGLTIEIADKTADTANVLLYLALVG